MVTRRIGSHHGEAVAGFAFKVRVAGQGDRAGDRVDGQARVAARLEREGHPAADVGVVGGRGGVNDLARAAVLVDRRGDGAAGDGRSHLVEVVDPQRDRLAAVVTRRVGGDHGEAVAGFAFEVRVTGQGDRAGDRVDGQPGIAARFQREGDPAADIGGVGGRGGVDHLTRPAVLVDRRSRGAAGDGWSHFIEVVNSQRDRLTAVVARCIGSHYGEAVAGFAFEVRVAGQGDRAGDRIDGQARVAARLEREGDPAADVRRVGGGGGVDHLARAAVLVNRRGDGAAGDGRSHLVEVINSQCDRLAAVVTRRIGGDHGEAVAGFTFKVRVAGQGDRAGDRIDDQARIAARFQREGDAAADIRRVGGRSGVDHLARATVLVNRRGGGTAGDGWSDFIEVIDSQRDRLAAVVTRRIGGHHGEAVAGFVLKVRVAGQGDRASDRIDAQPGIAARFKGESHPAADVGGVGGRGGVDHLARPAVLVDRGGDGAAGDGRSHFIEVVNSQRDRLTAVVARCIGGHHGEAVAGFVLKVRVAGQGDRAGDRIDGQARIAARFQREGDAAADIRRVGGRGGVDDLARAAVLVDRRSRGAAGDGRGDFIEVVDPQRDRLAAVVARCIGSHHGEAVAGFAFKVRVAGQGDRAGDRIDGQARIAARFQREGHPAADVRRVGGRRGINHLARAAVLVNRCGGGAAGDGRSHLVEVIDSQRDRLAAVVPCRIGSYHGEAVAGFVLKVRVAAQGDRAGNRIDGQARVAARLEREGDTAADVRRVGGRGGIDHLARAAVLVDRRGGGAAGDGRSHLVEVIDSQRDRLAAGIPGRIGGDDGEAVAGFVFEVRVADQGDRAGGGIDAEQRAIAGGAQAVGKWAGVSRDSSPHHLACPDVFIHAGCTGTTENRSMGVNNKAETAGRVSSGRCAFNQQRLHPIGQTATAAECDSGSDGVKDGLGGRSGIGFRAGECRQQEAIFFTGTQAIGRVITAAVGCDNRGVQNVIHT